MESETDTETDTGTESELTNAPNMDQTSGHETGHAPEGETINANDSET